MNYTNIICPLLVNLAKTTNWLNEFRHDMSKMTKETEKKTEAGEERTVYRF